MTVLARSGVLGLALFGLVLANVAGMFLRGISKLRAKANSSRSVYVAGWFAAYMVAILFQSMFSVSLETPMTGIWFWSLLGMALISLPIRTQPTIENLDEISAFPAA